ncbi:FAD:protein FMN transferase [Bacilli bacterium]|nr:FAD:protein FMN transferase [Bacilli bacterium]
MKKRLQWRLGAMLLIVPVLLASSGCQKKEDNSKKAPEKKVELMKEPYKNEEFATGTYVEILIYDKGHGEADFEVARKQLKELAAKFEIYEQGESELDKVNAQAGIAPVKVSKITFELVKALDKYAQTSDGYYNPTVGVMTHLWHIGFSDAQVPSEELIKATLDKVNVDDIVLDAKNQTVFLKKKGMMIEADGIGKGFIGAQLLETLKARGVTTAVVNLGGHAYTIGKNPDREDGAWEVGVANPTLGESQDSPLVGVVASHHTSFNTTNYYGRYLKVGDKVYSHLFDTKTGYPVETDLLSVTMVGDTPYHDDAYSNALMNMGLEKGMKYVNAHDELDAIFITKNKEVHISKNIPGEFELLDKSFTVVKGVAKK